jgi:hypothetical protein
LSSLVSVALIFAHDLVGKPLHTFPDHAPYLRMILSENRCTLFRIMRRANAKCARTFRELVVPDREPSASCALHLPLRIAGIALRLLLAILLIGAVAAVETAGGSAEQAVMAGIMAGDAADGRALEAALGVGRRGDNRQHGDGGESDCGLHDPVSGNESSQR